MRPPLHGRTGLRLAAALAALAPLAGTARGAASSTGPGPLRGPGGPAPRIELITMDAGDELFTRFGHAALRVIDDDSDLVYNYGVTDFSQPGRMVVNFLFGRVPFWVEPVPWAATVEGYAEDDRTIYRQPLALTDAEARDLAGRLAWNVLPAHRTYLYDHFEANCTTKVRDLVDAVTGGRVGRATRDFQIAPTYRDLVRPGFRGSTGLLVLEELLLGAYVDRHPTGWEAMFLPQYLRLELMRVAGAGGRPLAGPPIAVYTRVGPPPYLPGTGRGGLMVLAAVAAGFLVAFAALAMAARRWRGAVRVAGAVLAAAGLVTGLAGTVLWGLALFSVHDILRDNANLLVLFPTDLALVAVGVRVAATGRIAPELPGAAALRALPVVVVGALEALHLLHQDGLGAVALALVGPLGVVLASTAADPRALASSLGGLVRWSSASRGATSEPPSPPAR